MHRLFPLLLLHPECAFRDQNRRYLLQLVYIQSHAICNWNNLAQLPFGTTRMEQSFSEEVEFLEASNIPCIIIQRHTEDRTDDEQKEWIGFSE